MWSVCGCGHCMGVVVELWISVSDNSLTVHVAEDDPCVLFQTLLRSSSRLPFTPDAH